MSFKPVDVNAILSDDSLTAVQAFIKKKVEELHPVPAMTAEKWVLTVIAGWTTPGMWQEIAVNKRKMETIFKLWKDRFFGFGVEQFPDKAVLQLFRQLAKQEIDKFNTKASESRRKFNEKYENAYSDDDTVDYFCSHMAKFYNIRTVKKNVTPPIKTEEQPKRKKAPTVRNPYVKKKPKNESVTKKRKSPPRVSLDTTHRQNKDFTLDTSVFPCFNPMQNAREKPLTQNFTQDWTLPMPESSDEENENPN